MDGVIWIVIAASLVAGVFVGVRLMPSRSCECQRRDPAEELRTVLAVLRALDNAPTKNNTGTRKRKK